LRKGRLRCPLCANSGHSRLPTEMPDIVITNYPESVSATVGMIARLGCKRSVDANLADQCSRQPNALAGCRRLQVLKSYAMMHKVYDGDTAPSAV
jgi:hypothetical protein